MSLNPVRFGKDLIDQFGRYLLTSFPVADPDLAEQFRRGLACGPGSQERLAKGPYVYLNRPFVQCPGIRELIGEKALGLLLAARVPAPPRQGPGAPSERASSVLRLGRGAHVHRRPGLRGGVPAPSAPDRGSKVLGRDRLHRDLGDGDRSGRRGGRGSPNRLLEVLQEPFTRPKT